MAPIGAKKWQCTYLYNLLQTCIISSIILGWGKKTGSACALVALSSLAPMNIKVNISISSLSLFHTEYEILKLNCL